jgi:hypothetical protein
MAGARLLYLAFHESIHIIAGAGLTVLLADLFRFLRRKFLSGADPQNLLPILIAAAILAVALGAGREVLDVRDGSDTLLKATIDALFVLAGCVLGIGATLHLRR